MDEIKTRKAIKTLTQLRRKGVDPILDNDLNGQFPEDLYNALCAEGYHYHSWLSIWRPYPEPCFERELWDGFSFPRSDVPAATHKTGCKCDAKT